METRTSGNKDAASIDAARLGRWKDPRPGHRANIRLAMSEFGRARASIQSGETYGGDDCVRRTVKERGLGTTFARADDRAE